MNTYESSTGKFYDDSMELLAVGYSGGECGKRPEAVNNPLLEAIQDVGPLPVGLYTINAPQDTVTHGPYALPLTPNPENEMYGRSAFLIHGDSVILAGKKSASEGCIILPRSVRQQIWESGDRDLQVMASFV